VPEIENPEVFKAAKCKHSAIESSISALNNHGLDRCPDHAIHGLKRYVALAVVARNIQIIGHMIQEKEIKKGHNQSGIEAEARISALGKKAIVTIYRYF
jgi:hypothetical protein